MKIIKKYKEIISKYLIISPEEVFLFWKGRVALYAILKAIGIERGDEVIVPAYTCVVVVNPIIYLGAKPVYVDVDPKTYNIDPERVEKRITPRTKVILAQNTYGLSADLDPIKEIGKRYGIHVIEDCAHGFGGTYKGKPNGTILEASFFSTQWNKPFSTGLGGIAVVRDQNIRKKLEKLEKEAIPPTPRDELMLRVLIPVRNLLSKPGVYWPILKTYRFLSKHNLVLGSSQGEELKAPREPKGFFKGFSVYQAKVGYRNLLSIEKEIAHRKKIANIYKNFLRSLGVTPPFEPSYAEHTYLRFPIMVRDRKRFFRDAEREKIEIGDWFLSPIHPIAKNIHLWYYKWGENPNAEYLSKHMVNLPTHENINENYAKKIGEFLKRNKDNLLY